MSGHGTLCRGKEGIIDVTFPGTAIKGFAVWGIEFCANSHAFDQVRVGDKGPAKCDKVGLSCTYRHLCGGDIIAIVGNVESLEGTPQRLKIKHCRTARPLGDAFDHMDIDDYILLTEEDIFPSHAAMIGHLPRGRFEGDQ